MSFSYSLLVLPGRRNFAFPSKNILIFAIISYITCCPGHDRVNISCINVHYLLTQRRQLLQCRINYEIDMERSGNSLEAYEQKKKKINPLRKCREKNWCTVRIRRKILYGENIRELQSRTEKSPFS